MEKEKDEELDIDTSNALDVDDLTKIEVGSKKEKQIYDLLKPGEKLHGDILARLIRRRDAAEEFIEDRRGRWKETNNKLRMYVDLKKSYKKGDMTTRYGIAAMPFERSIVVPVQYSILHVLVTQLMSIFGSADPMIQVKGRGPEDVKGSKIMEAVLNYDLDQMNAFKVLYSLCQDAVKYGCGITYDGWNTEYGVKTERLPFDPKNYDHRMIFSVLGPEAFIKRTWGPIKEHNLWLPVDPMNYFPDPRVTIADVQNGEFVGHAFNRGLMWLRERSLARGGPYFNLNAVRQKSASSDDVPHKSNDAVPEIMNESYDDDDVGFVNLFHLQVKLIPKEWGLGDGEDPEIWWFTWANDVTIVRAHVTPFDHGEFTYAVSESDPDSHSSFNPGIVESLDGLQAMIDWLFNSHLQNLMRHLNDAMIFSPALIEVMDITNPGPGRHIRLTQLGEELLMSGGYSIDQFIHQLPVQDVTSPHLMAVNEMFQLAQRMSAANDPQMGMPTPDRRTLGEIQTITASSSQRISIIAKMIDAMSISKLAKRAISNRLQLTSMEQWYRIVGKEAEAGVEYVKAAMQDLSGNYDYVPLSAIMPPDPVRMSRTWAQILETVSRTVPMMMSPGSPPPPDGMIPNINEILKETIRTLGVKNVEDYYIPIQVQPDQQVEQQVQAGNMLPLNEIDPNNPPPEMMGG